MKISLPMQRQSALSTTLGLVLFSSALFSANPAQAAGPTIASPVFRSLVRLDGAGEFKLTCSAQWCREGYTVLVRSWNGGCERKRLFSRGFEQRFKVEYSQEGWKWAPMMVEVYYPALSRTRVEQAMKFENVKSPYLNLVIPKSAKTCLNAPDRAAEVSVPKCIARPGGNPWPDPDLVGCNIN